MQGTMDIGQQTLESFALLVGGFTVKQFVVDFPLQTNWMARGKERLTGWQLPLAVHAGLHGAATGLLALLTTPQLWWFALIDFVIHAGIDRAKVLISRQTGWSPKDPQFWSLFGFDQCLHHVTSLILAYWLIAG